MKPGAQLQAAIEILQSLHMPAIPADQLLRQWSRTHRFAGARDRAAIGARVYAVLRKRGLLSWHMQSQGLRDEARLLALASLMEEGITVEELTRLCDGSRHHPAPLSNAERVRLSTPCTESPPLWARANIPPFLEESFRQALGDDIENEIAALQARAPLDLRVNRRKAGREELREALAGQGFAAQLCRLSPDGLRLEAGLPLDRLPLYRAGAFEVQDEGAQLAARLALGSLRRGRIIDLCAGGGGKTLAMAALVEENGEIIASDIDRQRLRELEKRARRAGVRSLISFSSPPRLRDKAKSSAELVLLDVPCSGSGTFRRQPENRWRQTPDYFARQLRRQSELLDEGARLVQPGGRLAYVTCSLFVEENERQIERFLKRHSDFSVLPAVSVWREAFGPDTKPPAGARDGAIRLLPGRDGTDGFFICLLERRGS
jgi:16S rRNA (cytosine967-C5)-methyltransferase